MFVPSSRRYAAWDFLYLVQTLIRERKLSTWKSITILRGLSRRCRRSGKRRASTNSTRAGKARFIRSTRRPRRSAAVCTSGTCFRSHRRRSSRATTGCRVKTSFTRSALTITVCRPSGSSSARQASAPPSSRAAHSSKSAAKPPKNMRRSSARSGNRSAFRSTGTRSTARSVPRYRKSRSRSFWSLSATGART